MTPSMRPKSAQVQHHVVISGVVFDAITEQPIPAAEIVLAQIPPALNTRLVLKALQIGNQWQTRPERGDRIWIDPNRPLAILEQANGHYHLQTWTSRDGYFTFLDLPPGDYIVQASLPDTGRRYGAAKRDRITVTQDQEKIATVFVELPLPPTTLTGKVTMPDPISMAKVQVQETGDYTYTNSAGEYLLTRLEASETKEWAIAVSAPGCELDASEPFVKVKLLQGQVQTQNFSLKRKVVPLASKPK